MIFSLYMGVHVLIFHLPWAKKGQFSIVYPWFCPSAAKGVIQWSPTLQGYHGRFCCAKQNAWYPITIPYDHVDGKLGNWNCSCIWIPPQGLCAPRTVHGLIWMVSLEKNGLKPLDLFISPNRNWLVPNLGWYQHQPGHTDLPGWKLALLETFDDGRWRFHCIFLYVYNSSDSIVFFPKSRCHHFSTWFV